MILSLVLSAPAPLRMLTYNIHHANPPAKPGVIDLDAVARVVREARPDVAMIQEVDVRTRRSGATLDQAAELGRQTGMGSYFCRAIDFEGGEYGVAILSRYPLTDRRRVVLPTLAGTKGESRVLALATLNLPDGRTITVGCTHLDAQRAPTNRRLQAAAVGRELARTGPTILGGDFNDVPGSETLRLLGQTAEGFAGEPTIPVERPRSAIDFVASAPKGTFRLERREVLDEQRVASDHRPVLTILTPLQ